jgi:hypothetical protein
LTDGRWWGGACASSPSSSGGRTRSAGARARGRPSTHHHCHPTPRPVHSRGAPPTAPVVQPPQPGDTRPRALVRVERAAETPIAPRANVRPNGRGQAAPLAIGEVETPADARGGRVKDVLETRIAQANPTRAAPERSPDLLLPRGVGTSGGPTDTASLLGRGQEHSGRRGRGWRTVGRRAQGAVQDPPGARGVVGKRIRAKPAPRHVEAPASRGPPGKVTRHGRKRPGGVDGEEQQPAEPFGRLTAPAGRAPAEERDDGLPGVVLERIPEGCHLREPGHERKSFQVDRTHYIVSII